MTQPSGQDKPELVAAFPMPTSTELSTAYDNLYLAVNGPVEVRNALGDPARLPRPWIPASCTGRRLRAELWNWLDKVVIWLNQQYVWDPAAGIIPSCWPHHPHLVNELAVLADQRRRAAIDLTSSSLEEWHRYCLPSFYARLQSRMRNGCDEKHTPCPAAPRNQRHQRNSSARADTFNADLAALTPPPDDEPDQVAPSLFDGTNQSDQETRWKLRLATDHGEIVDSETGETN